MRRLVPRPFDQIRPALSRMRELSRMRFLLLAVYATIIVLFIVFVPMYMSRNWIGPKRGFYVYLPHPERACKDERPPGHVVTVHRSQLLYDERPVTREEFRTEVQNVFRYLPEPVLYVSADRDLSFQEFMGVVDDAHGAVPQIIVVPLTNQMEHERCLVLRVPNRKAPRK